jgi:hypothetical protein
MSELDEAKKLWNDDKGYEAGLLIWNGVGNSRGPIWAARVLETVVKQTGINHPVLGEVFECAHNPSRWHDGHKVFDSVRHYVLKLDEQLRKQRLPELETLNHVLGLGELVAKVTYNATNPLDEFDEDSAAWIVALARGFANVSNDEVFEQQIWNAVTSIA